MKATRFGSLLFLVQISISGSTFLNGKHLIVGMQPSPINLDVKRNASGHITEVQGVAAKTLIALSERFNFTYSILQVNDTRLEKESDTLPGLHYYLVQGKCDVIIGAIAMTFVRNAVMDFAEGYGYTSIALVIPMPEELLNRDAVLQPFQLSVWIALVVIMPITAVAIFCLAHPVNCKKPPSNESGMNTTSTAEKTVVHSVTTFSISQAFFQIFRILMSQANFVTIRPALYFVFGFWSLAALVLTSAYNSVLISHILGSDAKPLVDSMEDLVGNPKVHIAMVRGRAADFFMAAVVNGLIKQAGDKVRSNPKSQCDTTEECIDRVKSGHYACILSIQNAIDIINEDYKATGVCHLSIARKSEPMPGTLAWALPKNSPYTRLFTIGFMELEEAGQFDRWIEMELRKYKNATYCLEQGRKRQNRIITSKKQAKISLKNFSGTFDLLMIGFLVSLVFFVREVVYSKISNYLKKKRSASHKVITENNENTN